MTKTKDAIQAEALEVLRKWKRCGAAVSMGVGKTRLGLKHFQLVEDKWQREESRHAKALVVAPWKKITKEWIKEGKEHYPHLVPGLEFVLYRSLEKMDPNDYDVIYLDECHSLLYKHDAWLSKFNGIIIGMTGTPPNPKYKTSEKYRMMQKYCPVRYEYLTDEAIDDGILNDYRIRVHLLSLSTAKNYKVEIKHKKTKEVIKSWWTSELDSYNYWSDRVENAFGKNKMGLSVQRMTAMKTYPTKEAYAKKLLDQREGPCILFANTQKQADALCKYSYHANNKDSEQNMEWFESGRIDELSCVFQLSAGANVKNLKFCIIMHAYGNNRSAPQRIGRMLRLNPDETAHIDILCFKDTVDVEWVKAALADLDPDKIEWYDPDIF